MPLEDLADFADKILRNFSDNEFSSKTEDEILFLVEKSLPIKPHCATSQQLGEGGREVTGCTKDIEIVNPLSLYLQIS